MKAWIDLNAQVDKHTTRGLDLDSISKRDFAMFLYSNNYYRVSGYARCLYQPNSSRYKPGITAAQLMDIYDLDRAVRNLVLDGVSVVEPTVRSRVAYHLAETINGSDAYLNPSMYLPNVPQPGAASPKAQHRWTKQIENRSKVIGDFQDLQGRNEIFIRHHIDRGDPVPFWAAIEVVSLGTFSRFLRALADQSILDPVTKSLEFEDNHKLLQAVQNITFLRNIAAHHGRLWNRRLNGHVTLPGLALNVKRAFVPTKSPAALLTLLAGMVDQIEKSDQYSTQLLDLVHSVPEFVDGYYYPIL